MTTTNAGVSPERPPTPYAAQPAGVEAPWDIVIGPGTAPLRRSLRELWRYRDLLLLLVRRDFVAFYKQTVLGPAWFFLQPIFAVGVFMLVFGNIAGLSTDGLPQPLFYLTGFICWSYFAECLTKTATVFRDNAHIFGKIYFPRLIVPLSLVVSNLARFGAQFLLLLVLMAYYALTQASFAPSRWLLALPLLIACMAGLGLGLGLVVSALTTKYRDLAILLTFGVQLLMYATPVVYPLSALGGTMAAVVGLNPMTPVIEGMRLALLGSGTFGIGSLAYAVGGALVLLGLGLATHSRVERDFVDTI